MLSFFFFILHVPTVKLLWIFFGETLNIRKRFGNFKCRHYKSCGTFKSWNALYCHININVASRGQQERKGYGLKVMCFISS